MTDTQKQTAGQVESLTRAIKQAYQRAYRKGVEDADELAVFAYDEIADWRTTANTKAAWLRYIKELSRTKSNGSRNNGRQYGLHYRYVDDLDELYPIRRPAEIDPETDEVITPAHTDRIALGDFKLPEVHQHDVQLETNIAFAIDERNEWERIKILVVPLLDQYPEWNYRDAIAHLKESGALPDFVEASGADA